MKFSRRTEWHHEPNRLSELLEARRKSGKPLFDLTLSNPTNCGIVYPEREIAASLSNTRSLRYQPDPHGLPGARECVSRYYQSRQIGTDPSRIFLTSSTSEAYSILFSLLCDSGGEILVPQPSYPLFDFLAQIHDVKLVPYRLAYDHEWSIDLDSVRGSITPATRALVIVNPHNPAGLFLHEPAYVALKEVAAKHSLALIVDEVFIDYPLNPNTATVSTAGQQDVLTFTLNGLSKMAGLPQMKLGWIVAGGPADPADEASRRLEILCDTFLSVNTPVQIALPELLIAAEVVRPKILGRVRENYAYLRESVSGGSAVSVLNSEGGWSGIIRVPGMKTDEEWALDLLEKKGVYLHPGYFYDFETEGHLVVSFLTPPEVFQAGVRSLVEFAGSDPGDHP